MARRLEFGFFGGITFYALAALGVALVVVGFAAKAYKGQRDRARAEVVAVKAEFEGFVLAVQKQGEAAEAEVRAKEKRQQEVNNGIRKSYESRIAALNAHLRSLRERPPTDPSGREIPITTVRPESPDGLPSKLIPLAEWESLRDRAAADALQLVQLQEWVEKQGFPVE